MSDMVTRHRESLTPLFWLAYDAEFLSSVQLVHRRPGAPAAWPGTAGDRRIFLQRSPATISDCWAEAYLVVRSRTQYLRCKKARPKSFIPSPALMAWSSSALPAPGRARWGTAFCLRRPALGAMQTAPVTGRLDRGTRRGPAPALESSLRPEFWLWRTGPAAMELRL